MSQRVKCGECGKDNAIDVNFGSREVHCLRCSRELPKPADRAALDPHGLIAPPEPNAGSPPHPAAALEAAAAPVGATPREYLYWLLPCAFLPLAFALGRPGDDTPERFRRTVEDSPSVVRRQVERAIEAPDATLDDVLKPLPGGRILGALLPRDSSQHWLFAGLSVVVFLGIVGHLFARGTIDPLKLIAVGLFTATVGVSVLLAVQPFVEVTYQGMLDGRGSFAVSLFGYIFGVGLFEEAAKLLPLLWRLKHHGPQRWRVALLWGLASGAGFGVAEGVFYSERVYNGLSGPDAYFTRFLSCVGLHAVWSGSAALALCRYPSGLRGESDWAVYAAALARVLAVSVVLHGLYDALLKFEFNALALGVALTGFGWLACQIEMTRAECAAREMVAV